MCQSKVVFLKKIKMEDYCVLGRIGEGAHGVVMKGRHRRSGSVVALKKILLKRRLDDGGVPEAALREIKALQERGNTCNFRNNK